MKYDKKKQQLNSKSRKKPKFISVKYENFFENKIHPVRAAQSHAIRHATTKLTHFLQNKNSQYLQWVCAVTWERASRLTTHTVSNRFVRVTHERWKQMYYNGGYRKVRIPDIDVHCRRLYCNYVTG
jgi:hypothetical protein